MHMLSISLHAPIKVCILVKYIVEDNGKHSQLPHVRRRGKINNDFAYKDK